MNDLEYGRACYARRAWGEAYEALRRADETTPLEPDDLEQLATAACLCGREAAFIHLLERQYRFHDAAGDRARAARCAFWLALTFQTRGESGQSNAWTARGQRLVADSECAERGYLALVVAEQQLHDGNADAAAGTAGQAFAVAESFRDQDLIAAARHLQGRALIAQGHVVDGLKRLDETMLAVVRGELFPIMTGLMYCSVIDACRQVYALGRAREWTYAFSRVCDEQPELVGFSWACMVHRAEILQLQGEWPDALNEACRACERAQLAERKPPGAALYQQAEIHRLRGEFDKAEEVYHAASERGCEPQPGLALLRLAQGRADAASAAVRRLIATGDRVRRARFLPAYLEIMLRTGDITEARVACGDLRTLAHTFDSDALRAVVAQTDGEIALAQNDARAALDHCRYAFEGWHRLEAPYETARVRALLGRACRALGDEEAAALEFKAARAEFTRLGAAPDIALLDTLSERTPAAAPRHPLTARELQVLRLVSSGRTNKEIAAELCLSERTIDRHVSNILNKLDVPTRAAAAAHAVYHKLF